MALVNFTLLVNQCLPVSLKTAEVFGKEHKNIIQAVQELDCSEDFRELNFQLSNYTVPGNRRSYPMVELTRDGFTFLGCWNVSDPLERK